MTSIEEADRKIDGLAAEGRVTPALLLTMAKAYSSVKETDMTKEEVKDIMAHLYFKVKAAFPLQHPLLLTCRQALSARGSNFFRGHSHPSIATHNPSLSLQCLFGPTKACQKSPGCCTALEHLMHSVILTGCSATAAGALQAKESIAADQPPEVRILKHLLTIDGEVDMRDALNEAFTPGTPEQTADSDFLST